MFKSYTASAGSGKTTHLVAEYLSICFQHINVNYSKKNTIFRAVLAITFTNNATAEMKERIIKTLHQLAFTTDYASLNGSEKAILQMIKLNIAENDQTDEVIREKSMLLLHDILYDYSNFSISTIDSFFQRLIRSFAIDLGLNLNFNLEINQEEFFEQTIDLLLSKIIKPSDNEGFSLTQQILNLVEKSLSETGKANIENELLKILKTIYDEDAYLSLKKLQDVDFEDINRTTKLIISRRNALRKELISTAQKGDAIFKNSGLQADQFYYKAKGPYVFFEKIIGNPEVISPCYMSSAIEKDCFTAKGFSLPEAAHQNIIAYYHQVIQQQEQYLFASILSKNLDSFLLLFELKSIMDEIKAHDNLFYLSETNAKIYDFIKDEETPYIYEKLGNRYSYFLIDEFQDTSKMQWENLLPLVRNALSGINRFDETGKNILFGDVKQAIYRFRNGDSSLLKELSSFEGYKKAMRQTLNDENGFEKISLSTNYRSSQPIVDFNNRFFTFLKELPGSFALAEEYYDDLCQSVPAGKENTGFVSIRFQGDDEVSELDERVCETVMDAVANRGFQYRDIAVLTKGNDEASRYAKFLASKGIPVLSNDSLLLYSSEEVRLLIASLHYLFNKKDDISKMVIVSYLVKKDASKMALTDALPQIKDQDRFAKILSLFDIDFPDPLTQLPLFSIVKELIRLYQIDDANPFIIGFFDILLDFSKKKNSEPTLFLDWWEVHYEKLYITSSREVNAVTMMTIHKAKGLQYPVVILPLRRYRETLGKKSFWYDTDSCNAEAKEAISGLLQEEIAIPIPVSISKSLTGSPFEEKYTQENNLSHLDNLNILYVAHTRPANCFYILTEKKNSGNYAKFLSIFIDQHEKDFIQEEDNENRYWFGNRDYRNDKATEYILTNTSLSKLYTSSFTPDSEDLRYASFEEKSDEQHTGLTVHDYLSTIHHLPQDEKELETLNIPLEESAKNKAVHLLKKIMSDQSLHPYFSEKAQVLNEVSIVTPTGETYRPDRIAILDNSVMVIDYKTGKEKDSDRKQIDLYISLLQEMGYENVQGRLIYVN